MRKLQLPFVNLPEEFVTLLKSNLMVNTSPAPVFEILRPNLALMKILEASFKELDDGRGIEKLMLAHGWPNFRDRLASIYIAKALYGNYPTKTDMTLVEDLKQIESQFLDHGVHTYSRTFLLAFYMKLAQLQIQGREENKFLELKIDQSLILPILRLSQGRTEKIDWLILIIMHLVDALNEKMLVNYLLNGKKFEDLYELMTPESRASMMDNLLAYGASIREPELFLYDKV